MNQPYHISYKMKLQNYKITKLQNYRITKIIAQGASNVDFRLRKSRLLHFLNFCTRHLCVQKFTFEALRSIILDFQKGLHQLTGNNSAELKIM